MSPLRELNRVEAGLGPQQSAGTTAWPNVMTGKGVLVVNADDWGRDKKNTDRILVCAVGGAVSSVSGMVFMEDSERAASLSGEHHIDTGLHLNFTTPFSQAGVSTALLNHQQRLARHLRRNRLASAIFHPGLMSSFRYVTAAQVDEYSRLYGAPPKRFDGHHHMHLSANVTFANLLPPGTVIRRNFSFRRGEKSAVNVFYRGLNDRYLARKHAMTDYFFSLPPMQSSRLQAIYDSARNASVELETHPVNDEEFIFLTDGGLFRWAKGLRIARHFEVTQKFSEKRRLK
jgi:predicted glycoside hydrolase/deacetylase ChbG (UPF0249 family)